MARLVSKTTETRFEPSNILDLVPVTVDRKFGNVEDFIEVYIYDLEDNPIGWVESPKYTVPQTNPYGGLTNEFELNPEEILRELGYTSGKYKLHTNVQKKKIFNDPKPPFRIKEIFGNLSTFIF